MYRFKLGQFKGMTLEHAMLRKAPEVYEMTKWARGKAHLWRLVAEFDRLRAKLRNVPRVKKCRHDGCTRTATYMTLPLDVDHYYLPSPYFWCKKHEPSDYGRISPKLPISFDLLDSFEGKKNRTAIHRCVLYAIGIDKHRSSISETFAHNVFARLDSD